MAFFDTLHIPFKTLTPEPWAISSCPSQRCATSLLCYKITSPLLLTNPSIHPPNELALCRKVREVCPCPPSIATLRRLSVIRECHSTSCSCSSSINIILSTYDLYDFTFIYLILKDAFSFSGACTSSNSSRAEPPLAIVLYLHSQAQRISS